MSVPPHTTHHNDVRRAHQQAPCVLLAASPGGHLDLLRSARDAAFGGTRRVWVTAPGPAVEPLRATGDAVELVPLVGRDPVRVVRNAARSLRALRRHRPQLIVTSGASPAIPVALLGRLLRIPVVFVETMARVDSPSASGRVLSRLAVAVAVQWPGMAAVYPGARVCRPALLEDVPERRADGGHGTFVALGTHAGGFDRLLRAADEAAAAGLLPRPVRAQTGATAYEPRHFDEARPWLAPDELRGAVDDAELLICHAGAGIISGGLRAGLRPVVMPRLSRHGEHFDDHQLEIAGQLGDLRAVVPVDGAIERDHVAAALADGDLRMPGAGLPSVSALLRTHVLRHTGVPA
ncbi:glycosyltransferase [Patulibacter sp. NPDC049589]|uniref:glycosyltransferase n=1 Tax=Patulibacter sp. NPDC049589 TaxID=3154731 RepID=UPI00342B9375